MKTQIISSDSLLCGAVFALDQCGRLLEDAATLFQRGRYPTTAALALLGREEMGRSEILLDRHRRSRAGVEILVAQVESACADHIQKQRRAQHSFVIRCQTDSPLGQLLSTKMRSAPSSPEWTAADEKLRKIDEVRRGRQPHDRHLTRMSATYVDLAEDGWSRPCDLNPADGANELQDAVNDYTSAGVVVFLETAIRRTSDHDDTGGLTIASGRGAASSRLMGACRAVVPGGSSAGSAEVRTPRVQARTIGH